MDLGVSTTDKIVEFDEMSCMSSASRYTHSPASIAQRQKNGKRTKVNTWLNNLEKELDLHEHHKLRLAKIAERLKENFSWDDMLDVGTTVWGAQVAHNNNLVERHQEANELEAMVQAKKVELEAVEHRRSKLVLECTELEAKVNDAQSKVDRLMKEYKAMKSKRTNDRGKEALRRMFDR